MLLFLWLACASPKVEALEARVVELESKQAALETEVEALRAQLIAVASRPPALPMPRPLDPALLAGVKQLSLEHRQLDRSAFVPFFSNLDELVRQARAIPHRGPDGDVDGYRLSGIRRGTVLEELGIRNGDIVHGVNGFSLTNMKGAMDALATLEGDTTRYELEISRRGAPLTLTYDLVDGAGEP